MRADMQTRAELWDALQKLREEEYASRKALLAAIDTLQNLMLRRTRAEIAYELAVAGVERA